MKITDIVDNIISKVNANTTHKNTTGNPHGTVFSDIGSKPTTVSGYGLTDVYTKTQNDTSLALKVNNSEKGVANGVSTLDANGKVVLTQIPDSVLGQLEYMGVHNFTTMPTATQKGQYWIASVSGNGYIVGDWAVWNGSSFDKVDNTDAVTTVAGRTGNIVLTKSDAGLANVDNTSDSAKPISTAQQTALDTKVSKVTSTDNAIVSFNGVSGELKNSNINVDTVGNVSVVTSPVAGANGSLNVFVGKHTSIEDYNNNKLYLTNILSNLHRVGTGFEFKDAGYATAYSQYAGEHVFYNTVAGIANTTATPLQKVKIDINGNLLVTSGTGAIGYGTGSGGTVTQLTDKGTPVTLHKPTGRITTASSSLAAGASVVFSVINNVVTSQSVAIINWDTSNYRVESYACSAGSFAIRVTNVTGAARSEALDLMYTIIKGANS